MIRKMIDGLGNLKHTISFIKIDFIKIENIVKYMIVHYKSCGYNKREYEDFEIFIKGLLKMTIDSDNKQEFTSYSKENY